jgi:hypothetical protein
VNTLKNYYEHFSNNQVSSSTLSCGIMVTKKIKWEFFVIRSLVILGEKKSHFFDNFFGKTVILKHIF